MRVRRSFTYNGTRYYAEGRTPEEAERNRERMRLELEYGLRAPETVTVAVAAEMWLEAVKNRNTTEKTYADRERVVRKTILPQIGTMKVADVRQYHVMQILTAVADKHTQDRVNKVYAALAGIFAMARANQFTVANPCDGLERPHGRPVGIRREATPEERNACVGRWIWLDMIILCGLRPAETARIRFEDVHDSYMWVDGTKNRNAKRFVPLPPKLYQQICVQPKDDYVCWTSANQRSRAFAKLDLGDLEPYCFRHSYITDLENCPGLSQAAIKTIVGHSLSGVTDRYTHSGPETCKVTLPWLLEYWDSKGLFREYML